MHTPVIRLSYACTVWFAGHGGAVVPYQLFEEAIFDFVTSLANDLFHSLELWRSVPDMVQRDGFEGV